MYFYIIGSFDPFRGCQVLTTAGGCRLSTSEVCVEFLCLVFVLSSNTPAVFLISCVFFNSVAIPRPSLYLCLALLTPRFCFHHCLCCVKRPDSGEHPSLD